MKALNRRLQLDAEALIKGQPGSDRNTAAIMDPPSPPFSFLVFNHLRTITFFLF